MENFYRNFMKKVEGGRSHRVQNQGQVLKTPLRVHIQDTKLWIVTVSKLMFWTLLQENSSASSSLSSSTSGKRKQIVTPDLELSVCCFCFVVRLSLYV